VHHRDQRREGFFIEVSSRLATRRLQLNWSKQDLREIATCHRDLAIRPDEIEDKTVARAIQHDTLSHDTRAPLKRFGWVNSFIVCPKTVIAQSPMLGR
jgi:hypothetical protein